MSAPMQVVIPMSGIGKRFLDRGYTQPKPLIEVAGKPIIEHLVEKFPKDWEFVFICNADHLKNTPLKQTLLKLRPKARIVSIAPHKKGPVYAVMQAAGAVTDELPTIVNYCDFSFIWDAQDFAAFAERTGCDGAILSYKGFHAHYLRPTMYAYSRESNGRVVEVKEKGCFTDNRENEPASSGSYYFKSGKLVKKYFQKALDEDVSMNGEYYVSLVYNLLIRDGLDVRVYEIPYFLQWGTPEDLEDYQYWHRLFEKLAARRAREKSELRLLMPMAGFGKRFQNESGVPKPLIPVMGHPMYELAIQYLPCNDQDPVFVCRDELAGKLKNGYARSRIVSLSAPTEGQAVTCLKAREALDPQQPVLVSACDHGLLWDEARWQKLLRENPDVVIFTQSNYPDASRSPNSYAYVEPKPGTDRIRSVSVKKPLSSTPQKDRVLVGTFYFRSASLMFEAIEELIRKNIRVNNEFYLDSVVNLCIEAGRDVRYFDCDGYLCWGNPNALKEFNYWQRYFSRAAA